MSVIEFRNATSRILQRLEEKNRMEDLMRQKLALIFFAGFLASVLGTLSLFWPSIYLLGAANAIMLSANLINMARR